jgi:hypothetical protein
MEDAKTGIPVKHIRGEAEDIAAGAEGEGREETGGTKDEFGFHDVWR